MLNRAARYFPILRALQPHLRPGQRLLEVGSGPVGIGEFFDHGFVGCDVSFPERPRSPMRPVVASALQLPFADEAFDIVLLSDVMEHIPPAARPRVVVEALRVTRTIAVFGFPAGPLAHKVDEDLIASYRARNSPVPSWLSEHMLYTFPDSDLFNGIGEPWQITTLPNENVQFHRWMMHKEMAFPWRTGFQLALWFSPGRIERWLRTKDTEPCYRHIFLVSRRSDTD